MTISYEQLSREKRAQQINLIPAEWRLQRIPSVESVPNALDYIRTSKLLTRRELSITETTDVAILLGKLARRELSSVEVTRAFAKRAALAHQLTTCCTEIFFQEAFARAQELDEILATTGKTTGPLHGLPVSIKDLFDVEGVDTSIGRDRRYLSLFGSC
jgi:amidase